MNNSVNNSREWNDCLTYISRRVNKQPYNTWFKRTVGEPSGNGTFHLGVANEFVAQWIESNYSDLIHDAFNEVLERDYDVEFIMLAQGEEQDQTEITFDQPQEAPGNGNGRPAVAQPRGNSNLSGRYRFDSLVVGDFNQFAAAASMAVAEGPGLTKYNPLYIYGGTGLGKTHIVQAIGHEILENFPDKRVLYATSEQFTTDFISAISDRTIGGFTKVYRDVDVLIIDDIQFFTGKEGTQEQFFHTFNDLHQQGKQIVLSSDRPPNDIKGLEDRLLSRFKWGLVTDLQAPDLENRMAILRKKLESEGTSVPDDVVRYIADKINTNIRELEGSLIRVLAYASLKKQTVDLEMARKVLADAVSKHQKEVTIETIQQKTAEFFKIPVEMMSAKKKTAHIALARQVAMYLCRSLTDFSLKAIGKAFGGRDHSTVIHACDLISKRMADDAVFRDKIDNISAALLY